MRIQRNVERLEARGTAARDHVATPVAAPSGLLQRACDCGQHTGGGSCHSCATEAAAARPNRSTVETAGLPNAVGDVLRSPGRSLDGSVRSFMEPRFGHDFSHVRVHTGEKAAASAAFVGARAYTIGNDIVFGAGTYAPGSAEGRRLIAHELTHTLQQRQGPSVQAKPLISGPQGADEQQAERVADAIMAGSEPVSDVFASPSGRLQRDCGPAQIGTPAGCDPQAPTFVAGQKLVKFNFDCDTFAPGEEASLVTFTGRIATSGPVTIHGYASTDGDPTYNKHLSCARALKTKSLLETNGVASARITTQRHGPTAGPVDERRSTTVEAPLAPTPVTPPPMPLSVAFTNVDADTSPAGMPDRIPPRVDTIVGVGVVGFTPPMAPITISVDGSGGGNGDLTIDGAATASVTSSTALRLRGTTQTDVGNGGNLSLVAEQGGTRLATSNSFSVSSIPQNWSISFRSLVTGPRRGFVVNDRWESDSGVVADLDETEISEIVDPALTSGSLAGVGITVSGFLPGDSFTTDEHSSSAATTATGTAVLNQVSIFNDDRTGATDIPLTNGGYQITHIILGLPATSIVTTAKNGASVTAGGFTSNAGAGSVIRTQTIP
ncbi:eCIS core domain-containing protein [Halomonas sp. LBP4]|uniref:eCIS core domain-containing protein n=1 Tax=Halomonas sp. LBP4 TaxID=2044917 RepID=UPI000D752DAD|nr:DUF4157 domain-containing protein [Halomonas sp. LBP4]PXX98169.1 hypothetical protein CR157_07495 [Halomonas sp. LBP4]